MELLHFTCLNGLSNKQDTDKNMEEISNLTTKNKRGLRIK